MHNLVVFASGSGSNFQAIIDAVEKGELEAQITGLISDKKNAGALDRARNHDIPVYISGPSDFEESEKYEKDLLGQLRKWKADLILLAGYLKKIPVAVIEAYRGKILNIHPSLLPKYGGKGFYGMHVHRAVIEAGETESGCSVHIVTEEFDEGPVIGQKVVTVKGNDTPDDLAKRILKQEHILYPEVIKNYLTKLKTNS